MHGGAPADTHADRIARLRLIRTAGIGPVTYRQLVQRFVTAEAALAAVPELARRGGGAAPALASLAQIEREVAAVEAAGARYLFVGVPGYPAMLAEIPTAPPALIVRGERRLLDRPVLAMVGARNASASACRFARGLAAELGPRGVAIASGLARGIDTAAHDGSLAHGTIGVIAGGIDIAYPPENAALRARIADEGLLIAEQPPGTEPRARHFPYRNRIIAGARAGGAGGRGCAQVRLAHHRAPRRRVWPRGAGGARLAARSARAQGCNLLIRDGATLVQTADDVMEALSPIDPRMRLGEPGAGGYAAPAMANDVAAPDRAAVVALLGPAPVPVDELVRQSRCPPAIVQTVLLELDLAARLDRHAGGMVSLRL